jgi:hypothetical protein
LNVLVIILGKFKFSLGIFRPIRLRFGMTIHPPLSLTTGELFILPLQQWFSTGVPGEGPRGAAKLVFLVKLMNI